MNNDWGTREELIAELEALRERVRLLEPMRGDGEPMSISDRVRLAIERSQIMDSVVNSLPDGVVIYDIHAQPLLLNDTARKIYQDLNVRADAHVAERLCCVFNEDGMALPYPEAPIIRTLERGETVRDQIVSSRPDQEPVHFFSISSSPIRDAHGQVIGAIASFRDVTLRREHERTIAFQSSLLESVHDAIVVSDENRRIRYWNRMAEDMFGWTCEEILGRTDVLEPELPSQARRRAYARMMRTGYHTGELTLRRKDGRRIDTDVHVRILKGSQGEYKGQVASFRDITRRKQAEAALRESEAQYRELVRHAPAGIYEVDFRTQRFRSVNDALCLVTGYSRAELLRMGVMDLLTPESQALLQQRTALWLGGIEPDSEVYYQIITKDGRTIDVELHVSFTRDAEGRPVGATGVSYDVTERKRIEDLLRASEERSRLLLSTIALSVWETDNRGQLIDSESWRAFTGQTIEDSRGFGWLDGVHPEDRERVQAEIQSAVRDGRQVNIDYRLKSRSGEWIWTNSLSTPMMDKDGRIRKWLGMNIDISTRKQLEDSLRQKVEELIAADRNKSLFMNTLSHELRNPLAAIVSSLDLLEFAQRQKDEARMQRINEVLKRQTGQLTRLVDDLLDVTRITTNKIRLKKESVDLTSLVMRSIADIQPQFAGKSVTLKVMLVDRPVMIKADPVRLNQVIGNLLHNALKFTPTGGTVSVETSLDEAGDCVRMRVADNGTGIEPDILPHIFEPFSQGEQTLARSQGGLGLGLSIVKGIVDLHGGSVRAESGGTGMGTCITVHLPTAAERR